jgi:hypothetical protein
VSQQRENGNESEKKEKRERSCIALSASGKLARLDEIFCEGYADTLDATFGYKHVARLPLLLLARFD